MRATPAGWGAEHLELVEQGFNGIFTVEPA